VTFLADFLFAALSIFLYYASYHPLNCGWLAWVALVPYFLYLLREQRFGRLALLSFLWGVVLFAIGLNWIRHVTWLGIILVAIIVAAFIALFAIATKAIVGSRPESTGRFFYAVPPVWCAIEYLRSISPLGGFPWFLLGHTQAEYLPLIQVADLTGVYGVSFLVVAANALIAGVLHDARRGGFLGALFFRNGLTRCFVFTVLLGVVINYGLVKLCTTELRTGPSIAIVQGNIPQDLKDFGDPDEIFIKHMVMTEKLLDAAAREGQKIDLLAWSETMFPFAFGEDYKGNMDGFANIIRTRIRVPFLTGAVTYEMEAPAQQAGSEAERAAEKNKSGKCRTYNSVYLFSAEGEMSGRYDKIHLVPVGEYVPLIDSLPWLETLVVKFSDLNEAPTLAPGRNITVFSLSRPALRFTVPICFESVFPDLVRDMVRAGSDFLFNVSNDGWFKDSAELEQCLYITAFRAVENRIGIVRATNTGISAFILPTGEVEMLRTAKGVKEVEGTMMRKVFLRTGESFFLRHGELFAHVCVGIASLWLGLAVILSLCGRRKTSGS
jgi:apolipoprotein N-acyltransferase